MEATGRSFRIIDDPVKRRIKAERMRRPKRLSPSD
jgi:hypothetical protein